MATDAIYKERRSDWSHQVSAMGQLDGCSVTRPFLSAKGVSCETSWQQLELKTSQSFFRETHTQENLSPELCCSETCQL